MLKKELSKILELSVAQKLILVDKIWDSVLTSPDELPLPDSQKEELDNRLQSYYSNPDAATPWQEVKERILSEN
ncbi:MAG: addiction module protein [bacterium]|nr:addiction module protein [bacterium]